MGGLEGAPVEDLHDTFFYTQSSVGVVIYTLDVRV